MKIIGIPLEIPPQHSIYLTVRVAPIGTYAACGQAVKFLPLTFCLVQKTGAGQIGLVDAVYTQVEIFDKCMEMAGKIAVTAPVAIRVAKSVINKSMGMEFHQSCGLEVLPFNSCFLTNDRQMTMDASVEKRNRNAFSGR